MSLIKTSLFLVCLYSLQISHAALALDVPYVGITYGSAKTDLSEQFDARGELYAFIGFQQEYYITYEFGLNSFDFTTFDGQDRQKTATLLSASLLAHLPLGDSSLFGRVGLTGYQYYDRNDELQNVFPTTYGAGFDLALTRLLSLRIEWQRMLDLEYNEHRANIESWRAGLFFYF